MKRDFYVTPKPGWLMRQFWKAAGADRYLLERSTYSDQIKYLCLGGIVIATGVMAGMAGGYAFYTMFEPKGFALGDVETVEAIANVMEKPTHIPTAIKAVIFGIIWGLIIFNIDRFIVTSTGKGDGTEAITWQEFKSAIPRIIMGVIIAITISKPVEIRMFQAEIAAYLYVEQKEKAKESRDNTRDKYAQELNVINEDIKRLRAEIKEKEVRRNDLSAELADEIQGEVGSGRRGRGPAAEAIQANLDIAESEYLTTKEENGPEILSLLERANELKAERNLEYQNDDISAASLDGLLERIKIVHEIAPLITLFVTLLFLAIELTPIFFKLMLIKGPYDFLEDNIKELIKAENGVEVRYNYFKDEEGIEQDLVIYHKAQLQLNEKTSMLKAQAELNEYAINKWKEEQKKEIDSNLEKFIKSTND